MAPIRRITAAPRRLIAAVCGALLFLAALFTCLELRGDPPEPSPLDLTLELLRSPDRDMRGLGLEQVRHALPGPAATRQFAELLTQLDPTAQIALIDALGERGDRQARPQLLLLLERGTSGVRAAVLRALAALGEPRDTALLVSKAAEGTELERAAARQSLLNWKAEAVDAVLLGLVADASPHIRAELARLFADRKMVGAKTAVFKLAHDPVPSVRLAALKAAQTLADPGDTATLIRLLSAASNPAEHDAAENGLLALCNRAKEKCFQALHSSWDAAGSATRLTLLRAFAVVGGPNALAAVASQIRAQDAPLRAEALRLLSLWPDPSAAPHLLKFLRETKDKAQTTIALRGVIRLAIADESKAPDLNLLKEAWPLSEQPAEQRLVLAALAGCANREAFQLAAGALDKPHIASEAALATLAIAEKLPRTELDFAQPALQKILDRTQNPALRARIEKLQND